MQHNRAKRSAKTTTADAVSLSKLPVGISNDRTFEWKYVEELWHAITQVPSLRIVTARELALVWYGQIVQDAQDEEVLEGLTRDIMYVLAEDYEQKYFVRQSALTECIVCVAKRKRRHKILLPISLDKYLVAGQFR